MADRRRGARFAVDSLEGGRVAHRQDAHRGHRCFRGRWFVPLAGLSQGPGGSPESRSRGARVHPCLWSRRHRAGDLSRSQAVARVDSQRHLWRSSLRVCQPEPQGLLRAIPRRARNLSAGHPSLFTDRTSSSKTLRRCSSIFPIKTKRRSKAIHRPIRIIPPCPVSCWRRK